MYKSISLLIIVSLSASVTVTPKESSFRMTLVATGMDSEYRQLAILKTQIFTRLLVQSSSVSSRSKVSHLRRTHKCLAVEAPARKTTSSYSASNVGHFCVPGSSAFQRFSHSIMDVSSTLCIETRSRHRFNAIGHVTVKVLLLAVIYILLKGNFGQEPHCLISTALILYWDVSSVIASPLPSFSSSLQISPTLTSNAVASLLSTYSNATHTTPISTSTFLAATPTKENQLSHSYQRTTIESSSTSSLGSTVTSTETFVSTTQPVIESSTSTDMPFKQGKCDQDWFDIGKQRCYKLVKEAKRFGHAQKVCYYQGAHIVSISNEEENDFIFRMTRAFIYETNKHAIWIGLQRRSSDSKLHWVDDKPLDYHNWAPGEPDSNGACVKMIHKAWWEDTDCSQQLFFVCEREPRPSPPYSRTVELGVLIGIPLACSLVMLSVVAVLFVKSVQDSEGTHFGYGKNRDKETLHSCLVNLTTSISNIGIHDNASEQGGCSASPSQPQSPSDSRRESIITAAPPEIRITPGTPELVQRQETKVFASTSSIEQEPSRFQSTTSLDHLLSKSYFKPKGRRMRSLRRSEAVVSPAGKEGTFRKRDQ